MTETPVPPADRRARWAVAGIAAAATLAIRLQHLAELHRDGRWWLVSGDSWWHAVRMQQAAAGNLAWFDRLTHAPEGNWTVWPPGFDWLGGQLARLFGSGLDAAVLGGMALVALLSAATSALAAAVAMRLAPGPLAPLAGLAAGLAAAIHGGLHNYLQAGKTDHHAAEPLLTLLAVDAALKIVANPVSLTSIGGLALALAAAFWLWPSSALTIALVAAAAAVRWLIADPPSRPVAAAALARAFLAAGLLALPLAALSPFGAGLAAVAHAPSYLQPALLVLAAASFAALSRGRTLARGLALAPLPILLALLLWPSLRHALLGGGDFVAGKSYVAVIAESAPVWQSSPAQAMAILSWLLLAAPWLAWRACLPTQDRALTADRRTMAVCLAAGAALAVLQTRFATLAALPLAVLWGVALAELAGQSPRRRSLALALVALATVAGAAELNLRPLPLAKRVPTWQAIDWLRRHAPLEPPPPRQAFTVLASWSLGHDLRAVGGLANVCSPLIAPEQTRGLDACLRLHLDDGTGDTAGLLDHHAVRYWLTTPIAWSALRAYAQALGENPDAVAKIGPDGRPAPSQRGACSNAIALHEGLGSASPDGACAHRPGWRLAYAAPNGRAKVFERVAGALVRGRNCTGAVAISAQLIVNGEGFVWQARTDADANGNWQARIPWSAGYATESVRVLGLQAACGGRSGELPVSESAVQAGLPIDVSLAVR